MTGAQVSRPVLLPPPSRGRQEGIATPDIFPMTLVIPAADCRSMEDLRVQIDRIDRELVGLLADRQTYIERAAVLKTTRDTVHDDARIEDVVAKVIAEAKRQGLSPAIAEPVWRELIARSIALELEVFDKK